MLNARAFATGKWAFNNLEDSKVFWAVAAVIFVGQIAIVQFFSPLFNCAPLSVTDWLWVILGTSPVFLIGQLVSNIENRWCAITLSKKFYKKIFAKYLWFRFFSSNFAPPIYVGIVLWPTTNYNYKFLNNYEEILTFCFCDAAGWRWRVQCLCACNCNEHWAAC